MSVDSAVLALVWGEPARVLVVRKSCSGSGFWACDVALPGGSLEPGEDPVVAALREAWEEAGVHPSSVSVIGDLGVETAARGLKRVMVVVGKPKGPLDPRPLSPEVDFVGWLDIRHVLGDVVAAPHPRRGFVEGIIIPGDMVLWGFTLRVLRKLVFQLPSIGF